MPPRTKQLLVDTISRRGVKADVFFIRDSKTFVATLFNQRYEEKVFDTLRNTLYRKMEEAESPEWVDVIIVTETKPFACSTGNYFGFELSREHVWKRPDGKLMTARWNPSTPSGDRLAYAHESYAVVGSDVFCGEYKSGNPNDDRSFRIPYNEALWVSLSDTQQKLRALKETFRHLVSSEEGRAKLMSSGSELLRLGAAVPEGED
jgi:hypothetical protein